VINPRAADDTPVDGNTAACGRKFVGLENLVLKFQSVAKIIAGQTFISLKRR
jgi:hypothetical protein